MHFLPIMLMLVFATTTLARADDFYKGKSFTIVVGFSPGGGYDTYARNVARYIGKHIPGNPTVVVQNMPGAGSLTSVRYLDLTAPKDGTVMTIFNPGLVTQSIVQPERVKLDFRKYSWIGVVTPDFRVCYGYGPKGIASWEFSDTIKDPEFVADMMKEKLPIHPVTGEDAEKIVNELISAPSRIVAQAKAIYQ